MTELKNNANEVGIDIWGSCVSRDAIGIPADNYVPSLPIKINNFFQECSPIIQFMEHCGPTLTFEDIRKYTPSNAWTKWTLADYNKDIISKLKKSTSEWLIVDLRVLQYGYFKITYEDGSEELLSSFPGKTISKYFSDEKKNCKSQYLHHDEVFNKSLFKEYIYAIKKRYDKKIILVETKEAKHSISDNGKIIENPRYKEQNAIINLKAYTDFLQDTDCFFIKCPDEILADDLHKWGAGSVHYISEYYEYCLNCINLIVSKPFESNTNKKLEIMYLNFSYILKKIKQGTYLSVNNTIQRAKLYLKHNEYDQYSELIYGLVKQKNPIGYGYYARMYSKGYGVPKDNLTAICWMRKASDGGVIWAKNELFDLLWGANTVDSCKEMISVISPLVKINNTGAIIRLSHAYRDGKGVSKDLYIAAKWMRVAIELGEDWVRTELFDVLWRIGTQESYSEMIQVILPYADKKNAKAMLCLAKAYRAGKGVEVNIPTALKLMESAVEKGLSAANIELFNTLSETNSKTEQELISIIKPLIDADNCTALFCLGHAYHKGHNFKTDLYKSADYLRKAIDKGQLNASNELFDVLWEINTPESKKEMIAVATNYANMGNVDALARMAMSYHAGCGVEKDETKAIYFLKKAVQLGGHWWKKTLDEFIKNST